MKSNLTGAIRLKLHSNTTLTFLEGVSPSFFFFTPLSLLLLQCFLIKHPLMSLLEGLFPIGQEINSTMLSLYKHQY